MSEKLANIADGELFGAEGADSARSAHEGAAPSLLVTPSEEALRALDELAKTISDGGSDNRSDAGSSDQGAVGPVEGSQNPPEPGSDALGKAESVADQNLPAEPPQQVEPVADDLDQIQLPPTVKRKSAEAFEALKKAARETRQRLEKELAEARQQAEALKQELATLRAKSAELPPEVAKELEELRKFRLAHEAEYDPAVRQLDFQIQQNLDSIYRKLQSAGFTDEQIARIRELGGPEEVDWEPILPKLPLSVSRYIEAKLVENEDLRERRQAVLAKAREKAEEYRTELGARRVEAVWKEAEQLFQKVPELQLREIPATASPEEKTLIETHNKQVLELRGLAKDWVRDLSDAKVAELLVGTALAYRYRRALEGVSGTIRELREQVSTLTKERDGLKADLDRIKTREAPRARSAAVPSAPTGANLLTLDPSEALDRLAEEIVKNA